MNISITTADPSAVRSASAAREGQPAQRTAAGATSPTYASAAQAGLEQTQARLTERHDRLLQALAQPAATRGDVLLMRPALDQATRAYDALVQGVLSEPQARQAALASAAQARESAGALRPEEMAALQKIVSDWLLMEQVSTNIGEYKEHYVDKYTDLMNSYYDFFSDVSEAYAEISKNIVGGGESSVTLNIDAMRAAIKTVLDKWTTTPILVVQTREEAVQWARELNLPFVEQGGEFQFFVDAEPLRSMYDSFGGQTGTKVEWNTARYSAWQTGFDGLKENMQTTLQVMAEGYTNSNSQFNEYVKLLIGLVNSLIETEKGYLKF